MSAVVYLYHRIVIVYDDEVFNRFFKDYARNIAFAKDCVAGAFPRKDDRSFCSGKQVRHI